MLENPRLATVRALAPVPWAVIVLAAVLTALLPGGPGGATVRAALAIIVGVFFAVLLTRIVLHASALRRRGRAAQVVLAGSFALWATGSALISVSQSRDVVTFPAPGELLCIVAYFGLAAFVIIDVRVRRLSLAVWLEASVVWGASISLTSLALVTPLASTFDRGWLPLLAAIAFPLVNLVLAALVLGQAVVRERDRSARTWMLVGGFAALAVADTNFLAGLARGEAYTTSLGVAAMWGAGFALLGEAASRPVVEVSARRRLETNPYVLVGAASLAIVVLTLSPGGPAAWVVHPAALATLVATGWRLTLALREARGAAEAMRLSLTDELTGLANRRSVLRSIDGAIQDHGPVAVLLLDIDSFKDINDSLGHSVGDEVLVSLAHRMRDTLDPRVVVARLGGDEFAVVVASQDELRLFEVAQEIRAALRLPLRVEGIDLSLDASVGIAAREGGDTSAIELLRQADIAMYEAKQQRAGVLLFDSQQDGVSHLRLLRGEALRTALQEGQLIAWYQPQVDARTRQVVAMEALVRWWHPNEGLLPPIAFLPDARRSGLMPALTEALMRQVVRDARHWADAGFTFRIAMNWAPPELVGGSLLPKLFAELDEAGLPDDTLLVEVTEDSFLADPERARMVLHELRAHGVQIAIDDYGSGFSSLAYLRDLPVQELKMDRSFVAPVATDDRARMIVQTTSQMARALGLRFVAEGVEDAAAAAGLVPLGVDVLQGYHIARPMPADAVAPWVRSWSAAHAVGVGPLAG
jgi:diguanylate cyclase (GGDEF)-like protein